MILSFFKKGAQVGERTWDLFWFSFIFSHKCSALDHSTSAPLWVINLAALLPWWYLISKARNFLKVLLAEQKIPRSWSITRKAKVCVTAKPQRKKKYREFIFVTRQNSRRYTSTISIHVWDVLVECTFALHVRDVTWAQETLKCVIQQKRF